MTSKKDEKAGTEKLLKAILTNMAERIADSLSTDDEDDDDSEKSISVLKLQPQRGARKDALVRNDKVGGGFTCREGEVFPSSDQSIPKDALALHLATPKVDKNVEERK